MLTINLCSATATQNEFKLDEIEKWVVKIDRDVEHTVKRTMDCFMTEIRGRYASSLPSAPSGILTFTTASVKEEEREAWRQVRKALKESGIPPTTIQKNTPSIICTIHDAIAGDITDKRDFASLPPPLNKHNDNLEQAKHMQISGSRRDDVRLSIDSLLTKETRQHYRQGLHCP